MQRKTLAFAVASLFSVPLPALALPTGAEVVSGSATVSSSGNTQTVTNSSGAIINWQSFDIAAGETTNFVQPSASSTVLNRVTGSSEASAIFGALTSNGQVFLINPNGVLFGPDAQVNVGGLVASTLDISDANFLAGNFQSNSSSGALISQGAIQADGYVALFVLDSNGSGSISTSGNVLLAAGSGASLGGGSVGISGSGPFTPTSGLSSSGGALTASAGATLSTSSTNGSGSNYALTSYGGTISAGSGSLTLSSDGAGITTTGSPTSAVEVAGASVCGRAAASCETISVVPVAPTSPTPIQVMTSQLPQLSALQPSPLPASMPVKAIASHVVPTSAPIVGIAAATGFAPQHTPAASGLLTLNLEKRDLSF